MDENGVVDTQEHHEHRRFGDYHLPHSCCNLTARYTPYLMIFDETDHL
jgi:hypothetical protein